MRSNWLALIVIFMAVLQKGCNYQPEAKKPSVQKEGNNGELPSNQVNFQPDVSGNQPKVLTNSIDIKL